MTWPIHTQPDVRLPEVLKRWQSSLRDGHGSNSAPLRSTNNGGTPVLKPVVLTISSGDGLKRFLTTLASISALREERSGEHMVTVSWAMEREALKSLIETSPKDGNSEEIRFELSMAAEGPATTSLNTWSKNQMLGLVGARCDLCEEPFQLHQSYTTICCPELQSLQLYHSACFNGIHKS